MFDYIKDHALKNVWCTPDQDNQLIFEAAKLTPINGALINFRVQWRNIALPDTNSRWHVYQVGQVHPLILGLFPQVNKWISFAETCNRQKMICDVYVNSGIQLPRFDTFYMYTHDKNLIFAVRDNKKIPFNFNDDAIYVRLYSNEYFNSIRSDVTVDSTYVEGIKVRTIQDILTLQANFEAYSNKPGLTYAFINGYKTSNIDVAVLKIGDYAEFVYDSSIVKTIDFKIENLDTFESTLDSKIKYLLHYAGTDSQTIDYQDDIDFYILDTFAPNRHRGVYYHKNQEDASRMVTHRDYSIVVPYVMGYVPTLQSAPAISSSEYGRIIDPNNLIVRLHVRKSGYYRPIIFEHNRIKELYKMNDTDIMRALLNIDSVVPNWRAEVLESSEYTQIMRSKCCDITRAMVQYGYGYNSISRIIGDTPQKPYDFSSRRVIDVPYGLQTGATAYEYDNNGNLLEHHYHPFGSHYAAVNSSTALIELISGQGSERINELYGTNDVPIIENVSYKVYACRMIAGEPDLEWVDITGTDSYIIQNNAVHWVDNLYDPYIMVRYNNRFLSYDLELGMTEGILQFTLMQQKTINSVVSNQVMQIPMGEIDIFLNRKSLIKNLDYFVQFPKVVIVNKEYLDDPLVKAQKIHVRFTGFCDSNFNMTPVNDAGFIEHGFLSNNNIFDIRDDKVLRIVVDGEVKHRDDLIFSELHSGVSIQNPINGKPYLVRDIIVPLKGLTDEDTYSLRARSLLVDKAVSDYLTIKIPEPVRGAPSAILKRYQIFSPFICKIIYDLKNGDFVDPLFETNYSDNQVIELCAPYEYLLNYDPTQEEQSVDSDYVVIHPHNLFTVIDLDFFHYRFVQRVVKIYSRGKVNLSAFLRVKAIE